MVFKASDKFIPKLVLELEDGQTMSYDACITDAETFDQVHAQIIKYEETISSNEDLPSEVLIKKLKMIYPDIDADLLKSNFTVGQMNQMFNWVYNQFMFGKKK